LSFVVGVRPIAYVAAVAALLFVCVAARPAGAASGGVGAGNEPAETRGQKAKLVRGLAVAPESAPRAVKRAIAAANRIVKGHPYCYGGGHGRWKSRCYDCSGSVSFALGRPGARLIKAPMASGPFMRWGKRGKGDWITVYANGGHMYAVIAGLRLDTSMTAGNGPGWSDADLHQQGFRVRHPRGL
jgi:hypothetical protein